jgi:Asp-tRNA(Asn)/Glu-tRNA(Gln) amidotransferase A subunit family amidase
MGNSEEQVRDCLERIRDREGVVHAWAHLNADHAIDQARDRDDEEPHSPLHGMPVGIKDIIDTADLPTERGTPIHAGRRPSVDAACVQSLRRAGAVILGKTVSTELATWRPGPTTNPHDPSRTPGGSSSGSAAAVGDGMVPFALGSQTVGSTIRPAAFCGAWGMKPTYGRFPLAGVQPLSERLDTLGLFARDAAGLGTLAGVLSGTPPQPIREPESAFRIGLLRTPWWDRADEVGRTAVQDAATRCARGGAAIEELSLPLAFDELLDAHWTIMEVETARALAPEYEIGADRLGATLREVIEGGRRVDPADYDEALQLAKEGMRLIDETMTRWDAILTPAVPGEAPLGLDWTGDALFCRLWSLLGVPSVAVPGLYGPHGMPVGIQLIGARGRDTELVDVAAWVGRKLATSCSQSQ